MLNPTNGDTDAERGALRYVGERFVNTDYMHGMLRPVVGASHFQVLRANRYQFDLSDGYGWTYNHAPMMTWWRGRFYLQYLSNPAGEHVPPGHTLLVHSSDGFDWSRPEEIFPICSVPPGVYPEPALSSNAYAVMHQRMGFFAAPNGRLLTLGFYGVCAGPHDSPNDGRGIGRVVREVLGPESYGPIYMLRLNAHAGWRPGHMPFPDYRASADAGFVEACDSLLSNRLHTLQWWEEDRSTDGFYPSVARDDPWMGKAFCWYGLPNGTTVGLWKNSHWAISADEGASWSGFRRAESLHMAGAKVWGQRTADGRYALVYNPTRSDCHRWPLAVVTSDDGLEYDDMLLVNGRVSARRYPGLFKDLGLNYVRGITPGNGAAPDGAMWVSYSMNKEDIWVSRLPVPVSGLAPDDIDDDFSRIPLGRLVCGWNLWNTVWASCTAQFDESGRQVLRLRDEDPLEPAEAHRPFQPAPEVTVELTLHLREGGPAHLQLLSPEGLVAAAVQVWADGRCTADCGGYRHNLGHAAPGDLRLRLSGCARSSTFTVSVGEGAPSPALPLLRPLGAFGRLAIATKAPPLRELSPTSVRVDGDMALPQEFGSESKAPATVLDLVWLSVRARR